MKTTAVVALAAFNDWRHVGSKAREGVKHDPNISNHSDSENVGEVSKMTQNQGTRLN